MIKKPFRKTKSSLLVYWGKSRYIIKFRKFSRKDYLLAKVDIYIGINDENNRVKQGKV